jgi:hypothetical protein
MVYKEIMDVLYENCLEHTNTLCGQNSEIFNAKVDGMYCYHSFE